MDEATLISDTWAELQRRSDADRTTRSYNYWIRINGEKDRTLLTVNREMLAEALVRALQENEIGEFLAFLRKLDAEAEVRRKVAAIVACYADSEERTADW